MRGGRVLDRFAKYLLTTLICIVALGQFAQALTRYVFQIPVMGLEETMMYPTLWLYILGAVNASRENSHIRANVLEIETPAHDPCHHRRGPQPDHRPLAVVLGL